jgi:hypothetical protein
LRRHAYNKPMLHTVAKFHHHKQVSIRLFTPHPPPPMWSSS